MTASSNASAPPLLEDRLATELKRMLLPQRFPYRRDVELAGVTGDSLGHCAFYDMLWLPGDILAVFAARVAGGGVKGALHAGILQRLVRASLAAALPPEQVAICADRLFRQEARGSGADLALATLDVRRGTLHKAGFGKYAINSPDGGMGALSSGGCVWLSAGVDGFDAAVAAFGGSDGSLASMEQKAGQLGASLSDEGAFIGVALQALAKNGSREFSMPNDLSAIAGLVANIEVTLAREGVPEPVGMALGLALDELLTNTVSYGFSDGGWHEILVGLDVDGDRVDISIRDDGRAFDPLTVSAPDLDAELEGRQVGGLGIHFARTILDGMRYERHNGWNVLHLSKQFEAEQPAG